MRATIDIAFVPIFIEVVRQGSFTKAARALGLPKSTVSRRVAKLEAELGTPLLARTTRKLRLTEAGAAFHARVTPALEAVDEAARALLERREPRGHLRISVAPDAHQFGAIVSRFANAYPHVTVEVSATGRVVDLVGEGFDLAIRAGRLADSSLIARRLADVEFQLFASSAYLEAHGAPRTVAELSTHRCVLFKPRGGVSRWTLRGPSGVETVEVRGRVSSDDLGFIVHAIHAGEGIGLVPASLILLGRGEAHRVLDGWGTPSGAVHIVYPATPHLPAKVRAFRDFLVEETESWAW